MQRCTNRDRVEDSFSSGTLRIGSLVSRESKRIPFITYGMILMTLVTSASLLTGCGSGILAVSANSTQPSQPAQPSQPSLPSSPSQPTGPLQSDPVTPTQPSQPSQPTQTPQPIAAPANAIVVKSAPYNAMGDGTTDDTVAIRKAIGAACTAGGGTVYFPVGVYVVSPQDPSDLGAVIVPCDKVTLTGAGIGLSVLSRKTYGDTDPDTNCPMYNRQVNRGAGIYVTAKPYPQVRSSFHMSNLSLYGNRKQYTGMNGSNVWPAAINNCFNVWDISDKGVYIQQDHDSTDIVLDTVEVAYFSGELVYGGSMNSTAWQVLNSNIHHSNGDALSFSAGALIQGNSLHDLGANGTENELSGTQEAQTITGNTVYNVQLDGLAAMTYGDFYNDPIPNIEISSNVVTKARRYGIVLLSTKSGSIHDNQIVDSAFATGTACGIGIINLNGQEPQNVTVTANNIQAKTISALCGIQIGLSANVSVTNNTLGPGPTQPQSGIYISTPIAFDPSSTNQTIQGNTVN